ncbi:MAG: hypothetical protein IPN26_06630 [Bacteroidetes bacterium]|nr:hypothetical protein [Bacteroidota bacterium]
MILRNLLMSAVLMSLFLLSCTKNPLNLPDPTPTEWNWSGNGNDSMFAYINGVLWQCSAGMESYGEAGSIKFVAGTDGNAITVSSNDFTPVEYMIFPGQVQPLGSYVNAASDGYSSTYLSNGKVKILENDPTHIRGLFYFDCKSLLSGDLKKITKGYFNIKK